MSSEHLPFKAASSGNQDSTTAYRKLSEIFERYTLLLRDKKAATAVEWRSSFWGPDAISEDPSLSADKQRLEAEGKTTAAVQDRINNLLFGDKPVSLMIDQAEKGFLNEAERANLREMRKFYDQERNEKPAVNETLDSAKNALGEAIARFEDAEGPSAAALNDEIKGIADALSAKYRTSAMRRMPETKPLKDGATMSPIQAFNAASNDSALIRNGIPQEILGQYSSIKIGDVEKTIAGLKANLPAILKTTTQNQPDVQPLPDVDLAKQKAFFNELGDMMMTASGWTPEKRAAQGVSLTLHAKEDGLGFTMGSDKDQHVAFEMYKDNPVYGVAVVGHEMGHVLRYLSPNDLSSDIKDQPVGQPYDYVIHESTAMFFENEMKSREFMELAAPLMRERFGVQGKEWSADNLYALANHVDPASLNFNSTEGNLALNHAFASLDLAILRGDIEPTQAAEFWAKEMSEMTGETYTADQYDVNESLGYWADGMFMYTETYGEGMVNALALQQTYDKHSAQAYNGQPARTLEEWFARRTKFIQENVFDHGAKYEPAELMEKIMGKKPDMQGLLRQLSSAKDVSPKQLVGAKS